VFMARSVTILVILRVLSPAPGARSRVCLNRSPVQRHKGGLQPPFFCCSWAAARHPSAALCSALGTATYKLMLRSPSAPLLGTTLTAWQTASLQPGFVASGLRARRIRRHRSGRATLLREATRTPLSVGSPSLIGFTARHIGVDAGPPSPILDYGSLIV
jgi:hypothetical protein